MEEINKNKPEEISLEEGVFRSLFDGLRKEYLETISQFSRDIEGDAIPEQKRSKEQILKEIQEVHCKFINLGLKYPDLYKKEASPLALESFQQSLFANKNRFYTLVAERGYYVPEFGQNVFMIGGEENESCFEFRIISTQYDEERHETSTMFSIRSLQEKENDLLYFGGVSFDDLDPYPEIVMSPYATDVYEPSDFIKRNQDKNTLMQMKALQAYGDLICVPKINKVPFSGKRIQSHVSDDSSDAVTQLEKTVTRSPMTRRRTITSIDINEGKALRKIIELEKTIPEDDLVIAKQVGKGSVAFRLFLLESDGDGEKNVYSNLNMTIDSSNKEKIISFITETLHQYPDAGVTVSVLGFNVPPEWENPYHVKKHTKPHIRRVRRSTSIQNQLVIDDRSSSEWLEIKRRYHANEPFTDEQKKLMQRVLGKDVGIHFSDGVFSFSESAEGKSYSTKV